jgi:hypothetical protein
MSRIKLIFPLCLLMTTHLLAQESVNTTGGDAKGVGGSVAYSVGQVVYTTNTSVSGAVAQGVQHAYEIFAVSTKEPELDVFISVYPNPASEEITLQIEDIQNQNLSFELVDILGKSLKSGEVQDQKTLIDMSGLPVSTYFLQVVSLHDKKLKTFKIIKN